jgi:MFS family permease
MGSDTEKTLTPSPTLPPLPKDHNGPHLSAIFDSTSADSLRSNDARTTQYPPPFARWMIVTALLLGEFLIALDLTIVATAIPRITDDYQTIQDVGWYGSGYFLTFAAFQSAWGKVFKYFNMKYAFFTSVVIFAVGSLVCALAPTSMALIIGRALTGVGAAGVTNGVYTIIACIVPPAQVAMYLALVGMDFSIASVAGPLLGGVFTEKLSWRWCFWINLPIGGASLAVVLFFFKVPSTMAPAKASLREKLLQMDFQGTVLVLSSLVCYMLALEEGGVRRPWNSSVVIGLLVGFVLLAVLFGIDQWLQGDRAQIVGRIMKRRTIASLCAFIILSV